MRAMVIHQHGDPNAFYQDEVPLPSPGPGEIRVRVKASSVNPLDCKIRSGALPLGPSLPAVLHVDFSGIVGAVGDDVQGFDEGDRVFGFAGGVLGYPGALAEYVCVPAAAVALMPQGLDFAQAAVLPVAGATAWEALTERAHLSPGMRILIHAGMGGVGHMAVQIAKTLGVEVHATVSGPVKAALCQQLGADVCIDYRQMDVSSYVRQYTGGQGYDVVLDTIGGPNFHRSLLAARAGGRIISIALRGHHDLTPMHGKGLGLEAVFCLRPFMEDAGFERLGQRLSSLAKIIDQGSFQPWLHEQRFAFTDVGAAHACLESGQALGKIALLNNL